MSERYIITVDEALACLPDGESIHTVVANGMIFGADWSREDVVAHIRKSGGASLAGDTTRGMRHGICLDMGRRLFCEHDEDAVAALEAAIAAESDEDGKRIADEVVALYRANKGQA